MTGRVLELESITTPEQLAAQISNQWLQWDTSKSVWKTRCKEVHQYVYATDTSQTTNSQLPWNNKTTIPKLCQIADNLGANYMASMFPRRRWLVWEADNAQDQSSDKTNAIRDYMSWVIDQPQYKLEVEKLKNDYLHYGNCFSTVEWVDERVDLTSEAYGKVQAGYVGPRLKRINPNDINFNPTAPSFQDSPKIVRSLISMGEVKAILNRMSNTPEDLETANALYDHMREYRRAASNWAADFNFDSIYDIEGFGNFKDYLMSGYVEVLYFYGDLYDTATGDFLKNYQICVMDRCHIGYKKPNPSYFARPPIFHSGWRKRQDNLWAMGPLENLVGMQYRVDHIENMKADLFDLTAFPPFKRKGYVEDFEWGPLAEIVVDQDGDVELMSPQVNIIQFTQELQYYLTLMEEMAGAPKEAMGFRSPGEKTAYEVQRIENAYSRIYQNKIAQFEEEQLEPSLNSMLELARRNMDATVIRVIDDEFKIAVFKSLTPDDITGSGRIRPLAARHFAEKAERLQNVTQLFSSPLAQFIAPHTSSVQMAALVENLLEVEDWKLFQPNVNVSEQADTQKIANSAQEDILTQAQTPAGITPADRGGGNAGTP